MSKLTDFREQHPEYNDMSDTDLATALHRRFYSDMPKADFDGLIGLQQPPVAGKAEEPPAPEMQPGAPEAPPTLVPIAPAMGQTQAPPIASPPTPPPSPLPMSGAGAPTAPGFTPLPMTEAPDGRFVAVAPTPGSAQAGAAQTGAEMGAPPAESDVALSGLSGLARGFVGLPGMPGNAEYLLRRGAEVGRQMWNGATTQPSVASSLMGAPQAEPPPSSVSTVLPTSEDFIGAFESGIAPITHEPSTRAGRFARAIGEFAPGALFPTNATGAAAQLATRVGGNVVAPALASEGLGQALEGTRGETAGRFAGALLAPFAPRAALRMATPLPASARRIEQAGVLDAEGVPLTAGQRTGRRPLMYAESASTEMPFAGTRIADILEDQGVAFTQSAMRRIDEGGATIGAGQVATPEWIRQQRARIGGDFDTLTAGHDIVFTGRGGPARGRTLEQAALQLEADYNALVPEALQRNPLVHDLVDDIANAVAQGRIDGAAYQAYRSRFSRMAEQYRADPEFQRFVAGLREALDDAMASGIPHAAQEAWQRARREWRHLLVLEDAVASAGAETALGIVSPQALARSARSGNRSGYARGIVPFSDIAHAGSAVMERLPNSGTPGRLAAMYGVPTALATAAGALGDFATGSPGAFSSAGMSGLLVPPIASRVISSRPVQAWLGQQGAAGPLNAMGPTRPGIVGRSLLLPAQQPELLGERPPRRPVAEALAGY